MLNARTARSSSWRSPRPCDSWPTTCVPGALPDFAHEEVREHRFQIIKEMIERYDLDGIELDFQRHGFYFRQSRIADGMPLMTELIQRIRGVFDDFEQRRGHPICLMVRVPSWNRNAVKEVPH